MKNKKQSEKPLTAILVSIKQDKDTIKNVTTQAKAALPYGHKIQPPQGPALINGKWTW
jgi:hypothetical protein